MSSTAAARRLNAAHGKNVCPADALLGRVNREKHRAQADALSADGKTRQMALSDPLAEREHCVRLSREPSYYTCKMKPALLAAGSVLCIVLAIVALWVAIDIRQSAPGTTGFMPGLPFALMSAVLLGLGVVAGILAWIEFAADRQSEARGER